RAGLRKPCRGAARERGPLAPNVPARPLIAGIFAHARHRSCIARRARPDARRFDSPRLPVASLQDQVELQDLVEGDGGGGDAVAGPMAVAAHPIQAIAPPADPQTL